MVANTCGKRSSDTEAEGMYLSFSARVRKIVNKRLLVVSFLLGKSPASVYYCMPTFRNSLSVPSSKAMVEH